MTRKKYRGSEYWTRGDDKYREEMERKWRDKWEGNQAKSQKQTAVFCINMPHLLDFDHLRKCLKVWMHSEMYSAWEGFHTSHVWSTLKESHALCFIAWKWRTASIELRVNWSQALKLLDERVSIAPQQTLPVLSASDFLPRNTVSGGLPSHHRLHFNTLPLASSFQPTAAPELRLKETPWLSPLCSAVFLYQAPVWGEKTCLSWYFS